MGFPRCCAIVGSASFQAGHFLAEHAAGSFSCIVAADGGFAHLERAGIAPDVALGDFDSLGYVPDAPLVERHPAMKDASDLELALSWAQAEGFSSAAVYGALGGRLDQTMATQQTLVRCARAGMRAVAVGQGCLVAALASRGFSSLELAAQERGTVSVFAVGGDARGVSERGLVYGLDRAALACDTSLGLSNEFAGAPARIEVEQGDLLVFAPPLPLSALEFGRTGR